MDPARTEGSEGSSVHSSVNSGRSGVHTGSAKRGWTLHGGKELVEKPMLRSDDYLKVEEMNEQGLPPKISETKTIRVCR